jgi:hypothetical protein
MNADRIGDWMQTATGGQFWPLDPRPQEIHIEDIAWALAHMCRYGGHCSRFYSVAEHSVLVSQVCPPEHALAGLLHDASEAYCVDVPRPLKRSQAGNADIEERLWQAIASRFNLSPELPASVKAADNAVLLAEKPVLMGTKYVWSIPGEPANVKIRCLSPDQATNLFFDRFRELTEWM